jgi:hypothetical protein
MGLFGKKHDDEPVIDLRAQASAMEFGFPTPCPACGAGGYLDSINTFDGVQYQHCPSCLNKWTTTEAELTTHH